MQLSVDTLALKDKLQSNLEKHRKDYKEALAGYHKDLLDLASRIAKGVAKFDVGGPIVDLYKLNIPVPPKSYEDHYLNAIAAIKYHTLATIELDSKSVRSYMDDQWDWKNDFINSNSKYLN